MVNNMQQTIAIPTWSVPVIAAALSFLMGYAAMVERAAAQEANSDRIEQIVKEVADKTAEIGVDSRLNQQAIVEISNGLKRMEETARASDARLAELVQLMITESRK